MNIAILGMGTVGKGVYEILKNIEGVEVKRVLARHSIDGYPEIDPIITNNISDITSDESIDLVVESIGGTKPAFEYLISCIEAKKHIVTPNKNLISSHFAELIEQATANGVKLKFTSSVGGGIPWIYNLIRTKRCDKIESIRGIVNGTCNFILDAMTRGNTDFEGSLKVAKKYGYAEADSSSDILGTDSLRKTVISSNIAFDSYVDEKDVNCFGIESVNNFDISYAEQNGCVIRLLMESENFGDYISAYVEPAFCKCDSIEAGTVSNNNIIILKGRNIGTQAFYGQGAGKLPTGESVVQDILDIKDDIANDFDVSVFREKKLDNYATSHRYYLRIGTTEETICNIVYGKNGKFDILGDIAVGITEPVSVAKMHSVAYKLKENEIEVFFAGIREE